MADVITGDAQLASTKQDLIAEIVQRELQAEAKLMPTWTDVSRFAVKGAQSISFPKLDSFSVINRASGVAGDAAALTASVDKLDLDQRAYVAWLVDCNDEVQTTIDAQLEFARRAATAHGRNFDQVGIAELEAAGVATTTIGDISKDVILEMREGLCSRNADLNRLWLAVGCDSESLLLKEADFVRADAYGSSSIPTGVIGRLYGVNVVVSNLIGASTYYMYEQGSVAFGFQKGPNMSEQMANEYGSQSKRFAMDQLFGMQALQLGQAGVGATESALIVKDGN